ncbi:glucosidase II beta subunit-like protein-domain-containing protein [Trametes polyzona]|nr:glucosidase II beta subunit-like protein-domain-containing protein [Trametes polyzona]
MLPLSLVPFSLALALASLVDARIHHSRVPEDPYAFPKYRVSFLHGLPVLNQTAERWLSDGLRGGEPEFLDQPWEESHWTASSPKSIEASDDSPPSDVAHAQDSNYTLQHMRFGPKSSYVCLIPPPPKEPPCWSLLQPLSGKCLYHRQGWFTYSYCHNSHVRQFHELHHQHIPSTGEYKPEEDPEWEAYTLGRAPPTLEAGAELTTAEAAAAANLELARGAGSRYLVQRWGDGTYCDKTGKKRDVEVQFHCSMTMTDTILFVKETQTCHYVVHIATPRLCGEPGFRSRIDAEEEHFIRCREVLDPVEYEAADRNVRPASHPFRRPRPQKKVIAPPPPSVKKDDKPKDDGSAGKKAAGPGGPFAGDPHAELLRRALERLLVHEEGRPEDLHEVVEPLPDGEGELVIGFVDVELPEDEDGDGAAVEFVVGEDEGELGARLHEILRAAGYDVRGERPGSPPSNAHSHSHANAGADADRRTAGHQEADDAAEEDGGKGAKKQRDEL